MKDSIADERDAGFFNTTKLVMGPAADSEVRDGGVTVWILKFNAFGCDRGPLPNQA